MDRYIMFSMYNSFPSKSHVFLCILLVAAFSSSSLNARLALSSFDLCVTVAVVSIIKSNNQKLMTWACFEQLVTYHNQTLIKSNNELKSMLKVACEDFLWTNKFCLHSVPHTKTLCVSLKSTKCHACPPFLIIFFQILHYLHPCSVSCSLLLPYLCRYITAHLGTVRPHLVWRLCITSGARTSVYTWWTT